METLRTFFVIVAIAMAAFFVGGGLMWLPNEVQSRITHNDRTGWIVAIFGLLGSFVAIMFAQGLFPVVYKTYDLTGYLSMLIGFMSGVALGFGIIVGLDNKITDPLLDQKNIWKLAVAIVIILLIGSFFVN